MYRKILLSLLSVSSIMAFADETIKIHFDFENKNGYNIYAPELVTYDMTCKGLNNAYYVSGYDAKPDLIASLDVKVTGPFKGDKRKICKIIHKDNLWDDSTYFKINKLTVQFYSNGYDHKCIIDQEIGTSYDTPFFFWQEGPYNKLQGSQRYTTLSCGEGSDFVYKLTPGTSIEEYNPGFITISHK